MKIAVLDIETTGFLKDGGKIVEIGIVELCLKSGKTKELFGNVMHEKGITKEEVEKSWIVSNSSLSIDDIRYSKEISHYKKQIQSILSKYKVTAYNKGFDFGFLRDRGFIIDNEAPCPMLVATNVCKIPSRRGYKWPKVEEAYKFLFESKDYVEEHRGLADAIDEAAIIFELHKRGFYKI